MALAKDPLPHDSCIRSKVQGCAFSGAAFGGSSESAPHHGNQKQLLDGEDSSESSNGISKTSGAMTLSSCLIKDSNYQPEEAQSLIHFKAGCYDSVLHTSESLFSFQQSSFVYRTNNYMKINNQKEDHCVWGNDLDSGYQWNQLGPKFTEEPRLQQDFSCFQTASGHCSIGYKAKGNPPDPWLYSESTIVADTPRELEANEPVLHKRPSTEESMQAQKKQCNSNASKKQKPKSTPSMDPQSIAAKNRRERISERLKILQELVPNGSKVDLVTMLEKAISYVKFLQLQVKVLATDEFWPAQGGKAPDISQVKEAIDAILASHKDRNSTSD